MWNPFAMLREIRRNSRRVTRNRFDRVQGAGFVLFAFTAPFIVWRMESLRVRGTSETLMFVRVYETPGENGARGRMQATRIREDERTASWHGVLPLAEVELVQRSEWRGWPLVTSHTEFASEMQVTRLATCPASREPAVRNAADAVCRGAGMRVDADTVRSHAAAWVFSSGAWWVMQSLALAAVLAPLRLGWFLFRRTRTAVRQGRIDRCHCPNCGYNAKHSILRGRCPECGSELYERPEF